MHDQLRKINTFRLFNLANSEVTIEQSGPMSSSIKFFKNEQFSPEKIRSIDKYCKLSSVLEDQDGLGKFLVQTVIGALKEES
ncbi:MAG: hypothetical protein Hyperionvirus1_74 [Hyperionvirus sp.]|uniref:Uncharacterized protein n=1 Tax=Hyperionvirus sp. TaxID=2487770 RepID=A0A3G5A5G8_9VIRU|nr:MAG: hypothetical protein Hyperionvirus1_74 [Hyperionvirus sp.]